MEILERAFRTIPGRALAFGVFGRFALNPESELSAALRVFVLPCFSAESVGPERSVGLFRNSRPPRLALPR